MAHGIPVCHYGLLRPLVIAGGVVVLFCDEEDHTWFHPPDVSVDAVFDPGSPRAQASEGSLFAPPVRPASLDDLPASWRAFDWHEE